MDLKWHCCKMTTKQTNEKHFGWEVLNAYAALLISNRGFTMTSPRRMAYSNICYRTHLHFVVNCVWNEAAHKIKIAPLEAFALTYLHRMYQASELTETSNPVFLGEKTSHICYLQSEVRDCIWLLNNHCSSNAIIRCF